MPATLENLIEQARRDGVTHPDNFPFLLTPDKPANKAILLVHGFGATPYEMRAMANHLLEHQCSVLGVRLPGHGTTPEDLARQRYEDWLLATRQGYDILQEKYQQVSAVGLSTGSLLLLHLAAEQSIERLVLMSPFLRLKHPLARYAHLLSWIHPYQSREISDIEKPFYYQRRPLKGVVQLNRLQRDIAERLPKIKTPTLTLASRGDQTVYPGTAENLFQQLGSSEKDIFIYNDQVPHVLTSTENPEQQDVFQRTTRFLLAGR